MEDVIKLKRKSQLTTGNQNLTKENNNLKDYLKAILEVIKHFFRELLQIGNDKTKERTTSKIKDYYDNKNFNSDDIYDISKGTINEDQLLEHAEISRYMKSRKCYENKQRKR